MKPQALVLAGAVVLALAVLAARLAGVWPYISPFRDVIAATATRLTHTIRVRVIYDAYAYAYFACSEKSLLGDQPYP